MYRAKAAESSEKGGCIMAEYGKDDYEPEQFFKVVGSSQNEKGERIWVQGRGQQPDKISGHIQIRFNSFQPWVNADVLETDYQNYSIMYSCSNIFGIHTVDFIWILMR